MKEVGGVAAVSVSGLRRQVGGQGKRAAGAARQAATAAVLCCQFLIWTETDARRRDVSWPVVRRCTYHDSRPAHDYFSPQQHHHYPADPSVKSFPYMYVHYVPTYSTHTCTACPRLPSAC